MAETGADEKKSEDKWRRVGVPGKAMRHRKKGKTARHMYSGKKCFREKV